MIFHMLLLYCRWYCWWRKDSSWTYRRMEI